MNSKNYIWLMDPGTEIDSNKCSCETEVDDIIALQIYNKLEKKLNTKLKLIGITYGNSKRPCESINVMKEFIDSKKLRLGAESRNSKSRLPEEIEKIAEDNNINLIITGPATDIKYLSETCFKKIDRIITSFPLIDNYKFGNFLLDKILPIFGINFSQWNLNLDPESVRDMLKKAEGKTYLFKMNVATALTREDISQVKDKKLHDIMNKKHDNHYRRFGKRGYFPWDTIPLAILADIEAQQGIFKYKKEKIDVKRSLFGYKLCKCKDGYDATIAYDIDRTKFKKFLIEGLI